MGRRAMAAAGQDDAGAVAEAIAKTEPDAIFNVTFGPDLVKLVREGKRAACSRTVSSLACSPASRNIRPAEGRRRCLPHRRHLERVRFDHGV